jgi:hypothetical protein
MGIKENDIIELTKLYPDHKVQGLYKHTALYRRIYNHSKKKSLNIEDYLFELGFINSNSWIQLR